MGKRTVTEAYIFSKCRKTFNSSFAISGIYKIENKINHKVYIGQSKNIKHRFHSHIYKCFILNYNHPLYCSIRKYGIQNFTFTIIKKTFDLDLWEVFFTKLYNSADSEYGYNILTGREHPEYLTKEIMTKRKNTYKKRGYIYDAEMLKYLSDIRKGEKNGFYGKHHTEDTLKINREAHSKKVVCIETGVVYQSIKEASNKMNLNKTCIGLCCNGKSITCGGYHWRFYEKEFIPCEKHQKMKRYYYKCFDPIQQEIVFYYVLANRLRRHKELYKNIQIGSCVIEGDEK
ncbi:GIY-YIG nuclease family protein [bacterium]|nr:GIY-YIG nuclease family protein [bacterium]